MNQSVVQQRKRLANQMGEAATAFLATCTADQRQALSMPLDDDNRTVWHYTPTPRRGLSYNQMGYSQRRLANKWVALGLSQAGYGTAAAIMGLEATLDALEGWRSPDPWRDTRDYYLSLFGEPDALAPWGWRFEGHHLSLHYTLVNGLLATPTPMFFGANPADSELNHVESLRPLGAREDLGRDLVQALTAEQKLSAIISPIAPADIITVNAPRLDPVQLARATIEGPGDAAMPDNHRRALRFTNSPKGLAVPAMDPGQREILQELIQVYLDCLPPEIAQIESQEMESETLFFAWAGGVEKRQPHYYRIHGNRIFIEYDNTQDNANHIHSVWRDPADDFGAQLLDRHYRQSH
jgi:hypothetical protein